MTAPNVSLIIPTFQRRRFALRSMRFWSGRAVIAHYLDGSAEPIPPDQLAGLSSNIRYHHLPISIWDRLCRGVALTDTPYVAMSGDDEYFVPSALDACAAELEADPALVSCLGRALRFQVIGREVVARPAYAEMAGYTIAQDDAIDRMLFHMAPYRVSSFYSVMRREVWTHMATLLAARPFHPAVAELQGELAVAFIGKSKVIAHLMWLRSSENVPLWPTTGQMRFPEWWADPAMAEERAALIRVTAAHLAEATGASVLTVEAGVERALGLFADDYWRVRPPAPPAPLGLRLLRRSAALFPSAVKLRVKRSLAKIPRLRTVSDPPPASLRDAAAELAATGVVVDSAALATIERSILAHYA